MVQRKANDTQVGGDHYKSKVEHWDYVIANQIPYLEAMAIKYLTRWRKKGGTKDLQKAKHFMQKLFEQQGIPWEENPVPCSYYRPKAINDDSCLCGCTKHEHSFEALNALRNFRGYE